EAELEEITERLVKPFDLTQAPLFRSAVIKTGEEKHLLYFDMHHIISDGVSLGILIEEFMKLYEGENLEPLRIQYKDYAVWQQQHMVSEAFERQEQYWLEALSGELPVLELPTDYPRPAFQTFEGSRIERIVPEPVMESLRRLANQKGSTLYMVFLAAYKLLLSRYTGQQDIIVGSPVAGRRHGDVQSLIGMFVNTLAIRTEMNELETFPELLSRVKERMLQASEHQDYPFELLIEKMNLIRDVSRNPVFDTMFDFHYKSNQKLQLEHLRLTPMNQDNGTSKFDMSIDVLEEEEGVHVSLEYSTRLFRQETAEQILQHYVNLLEAISMSPEAQLRELEFLSKEERTRMTTQWNSSRNRTANPVKPTFHGWFDEQADSTPDRIAVSFDSDTLTYAELNNKANRLAYHLRALGVGRNQVVAIMVERSLDMVVGVLAILKSGGAFVPIDPNYPEERIQYMLDDSGTSWLVTHRNLQSKVRFENTVVDMGSAIEAAGNSDNLKVDTEPADLAYLIYTSGTTGKPKGVMIEHRSWVSISAAWKTEYHLDAMPIRLLQMASFSFDVFAGDLSRVLLNGGHLVICSDEVKLDPPLLYETLQQHRITLFESTPALIVPLMEYVYEQQLPLEHLELLILGSDICSREDYLTLIERFGARMRILNSYGVTEACIDSSYFEASSPEEVWAGAVPIGKPLQHASFYVLDDSLRLQPPGVYGDLYIGGSGISRGYLNQQELTLERFIPNPFAVEERLYRTGDVARWLPDGNLVFLGRKDRQVKINGYRIELGEIESCLLKQSCMKECTVVDRVDPSGSRVLCAYVVLKEQMEIRQVREQLLRDLPGYMVPTHFIELDKLPLTPNGKIDRNQLPAIEVLEETGIAYVKPEGHIEQILADIWQELLGMERVGRQHHFFNLGGDSIKAIQMASRLRKHGLSLEMSKLFLYPILAELAPHIQTSKIIIPQEPVEGEVRLTPIQAYFFEHDDMDLHHYNQSMMLETKSKRLNATYVRAAFGRLAEHHDALRMIYFREENHWKQWNRPLNEETDKLFHFSEIDVRHELNPELSIEEKAERLQGMFSLEQGPLLTGALFHAPDRDYLLIIIHHLVVDGLSWRILLEDFAALYQQLEQGKAPQLQEKTTSFKEWADKLSQLAEQGRFDKELPYWRRIEAAAPTKLLSEPSTNEQTDSMTVWESVEWTEEETSRLMTEVHKSYNTEMNDILLSALGSTLAEYCNTSEIVLSMEGHGREELVKNVDISRTVGWFTSQYPVKLSISDSKDIGYLIKSVKEQLREIPNKGLGYGLLKYSTRSLSEAWHPEISFNYFGEFLNDEALGWLEPSSTSSGTEISPRRKREYGLDINGMVMDGKLQFSTSYSNAEFSSEAVRQLMNALKRKLIEVIDHCCTKQGSEMTPSDLGMDNELSLEDLDVLSSMISNKIKS
ncbi:amino acid adenylation domain-containing protein, partial [Paenibacillus lentus]|uniref:amino acid adenylation domain-containing protein n=1 Tax=Paenibacillus lentus TaxID=1338368 RepID=UPI00364AE0F0